MSSVVQRSIIFVISSALLGCGPHIDPSLRPFIGLKKDIARFSALTVDQQIDTYLKVAALPLKPPDYSLSPIIATTDGDIGQKLADRLTQEKDVARIRYLIRLAGDYCYLNTNCRGQSFLEAAVRAAAARLPDSQHDPYIGQNMSWVTTGIANGPPLNEKTK